MLHFRDLRPAIAKGLALCATLTFLGGCVVTDPDYPGVLASAHTACKGDEVVGVWSCSSATWTPWSIKALVLMFRPDGTGFRKIIYSTDVPSKTTQLLWHYEGAGVWTSEGAKIRFSGNALISEEPPANALGIGAALQMVYIRAGNESLTDIMKPNP